MAHAQKRGVDATEHGRDARIASLRSSSVSSQRKEAIALLDPDRPLTEQQVKFARLWAKGESPTSAAILAGYSESCANAYSWKLRQDPGVLKIYNAEKLKYEAACDMSRKKVMDMLIDGFETAKLVCEPASMIAAAREIGKMCGYYAPVETKLAVSITGNIMVDRLNKLSDAELMKLIEAPADGDDPSIIDVDEDGNPVA